MKSEHISDVLLYHAKYVMEIIKTSSTNAPAATPYTQVFSFPSAETHTHRQQWSALTIGQFYLDKGDPSKYKMQLLNYDFLY